MKPSSEYSSLVLVGHFNPNILHPQWFAAHDIISQSDADDAKIVMSNNEVSIFSLSFCNVQILKNMFLIVVKQPTFADMIFDIVLKTFSLLNQTPISSMGINCENRYIIQPQKKLIAVGDRLAPKEKWSDIFSNPGLRDFVMEEQKRPDEYNGFIQARIQSNRNMADTLIVSINDHYEIPDFKNEIGSVEIMDILNNDYKHSKIRSKNTIEKIIEKFV